MAVTATLFALVVYLVVPTVLAATTYSRMSMDLKRVEPEASSMRVGRKMSEIDFPTNLDEIPPIPVVQEPILRPIQGRFLGTRSRINASRKPYRTIPVRRGRQGASKGTQSIPDLVNDVVFEEKTPSATMTRLRHRPSGPFTDNNGLGRQ